MIHKCIALIVPARLSEAVTVETIDTRQGSMQALFGAELECVERGDWHVYLTARPTGTNVRAARLLHAAGLDLPVARTAVFLGRAEHNTDTDLPQYVIRRAGNPARHPAQHCSARGLAHSPNPVAGTATIPGHPTNFLSKGQDP